MLTARTFAKEKGVSYTTIMAWLKDGLIPDAAQQETPMGMVWQIPASSLEKVEKRKPGPKSENTDDAGDQVEAAADVADETALAKPKRRASKNASLKKASKRTSSKKALKKGARTK